MKKQLIFVFLLSAFFLGCKESAVEIHEVDFYFSEPQPINDSELKKFPPKFMGAYQSENNDILHISDNYIIGQYEMINTISKAEFDSVKKKNNYKSGKLYLTDPPQVFDVAENNDSIVLKSFYTDTIFALSQNHKVKRINGYLVLSHKDSVFWKVNILAIKNDSLKWKKLGSKQDYAFFQKYVKDINANQDTTVVHIKPTRREFSRLLSSENLKWSKSYKTIINHQQKNKTQP